MPPEPTDKPQRGASKRWLFVVALITPAAFFYNCASPVALGSLTQLGGARAPIVGVPDLVITTFNVNYGIEGDETTVAAIENSDAHILFLQETTPVWETAISERVRERFVYQHWEDPTGGYLAGGAAILSTAPLRDIEISPSTAGWFDAIGATVETRHGAVRVVGVHLEPAATIRAVLGVSDRHRTEIRAHLEALANEDLPMVIAGDFNEERSGALATLADHGFTDAVDVYRPGVPTWRWPIVRLPLRLQLDHILCNEDLEAMSAQVLNAGRSDHLPVRATFRFR